MVKKSAFDEIIERHRLTVICHFDRAIGRLASQLQATGVSDLLTKVENIQLETSPETAVSSDIRVTLLEIIKLDSYERLRLCCTDMSLKLRIEFKNVPLPNEGLVWPTLMITISKTK